ncbi:MAG: pitrilysin family protein [Ignavibacteria bacterium]
MYHTSKIFPFNYSTHNLANGLKVILVPMKNQGLVSYYTVVRTGSRDEWEPGKSGFAHFFEHIMFRGTEKYSSALYDKIITSIGANANAYTSDDLTVFHLSFAGEDLEKVIELESDRFQNLKYNLQEFQTEAGAILGEYLQGRSNPWSLAFEKLHKLAFDEHPYKHTTIGFEEDIREMPNLYEFSLHFFEKHYRPENSVIVICGDFQPQEAINYVMKYYSDWRTGHVPPVINPEPEQLTGREAEIIYHGKTMPLLLLGYKSDAFNINNKNMTASVLLAELAFGSTSEIYKKLILREQKVQLLRADFGFSRDPKLFYINSMVNNPFLMNYVRNEIFAIIAYYQNCLVDNARLENLKRRERYTFLMNMNTAENVASFLAQFIALTGGIEVIDELYCKLQDITPQDIMEAANYYFAPEKRNIVYLNEKI